MTYIPDATIGTMPTLDRVKFNADNASAVTSASALGSESARTGTVFNSRKLEFPDHIIVQSDSCGHKLLEWRNGGGAGKPLVFEDVPAPVYRYLFVGDHNPEQSNIPTWESQSFVNAVAIMLVPAWTAAGSVPPLMRLARLSLSVALIVNHETLSDSDDIEKFGSNQEIAQSLVVRAHRISYAGLRQRRFVAGSEDTLEASYVADFVSEDVDAWKCGSKTGMRARSPRKGVSGNVPNLGAHPQSAGGAPGSFAYRTFQCTTLLAGESLAQRQNLAPGDAIVVSVTGPPTLIYAGESSPKSIIYGLDVENPSDILDTLIVSIKRNIILPVRGSWAAGVFVAEQAQ